MAQSQAKSIVSASSVRLCEGELYKRGKVNKSWKCRWFVMNMNFELNYFESKWKSEETLSVNNNSNSLGKINLLQVQKIQVSLIGDTLNDQIPKYIKILANAKSDRSLLIYLITNNRKYTLSANDSAAFLKWLKYFHEYLYGGVLFESMLEKKGEVNKAFKKRYFVLNKFKQLKYYNNGDREILHGFIDLNDKTIELKLPQQDHHFNRNNHIELASQKRQWILKCGSVDLFQKWIAYLSNLEEIQGNNALKPSNEKNEDEMRLDLLNKLETAKNKINEKLKEYQWTELRSEIITIQQEKDKELIRWNSWCNDELINIAKQYYDSEILYLSHSTEIQKIYVEHLQKQKQMLDNMERNYKHNGAEWSIESMRDRIEEALAKTKAMELPDNISDKQQEMKKYRENADAKKEKFGTAKAAFLSSISKISLVSPNLFNIVRVNTKTQTQKLRDQRNIEDHS